MKSAILDIETNALWDPTEIHCVVLKDTDTNEIHVYSGENIYNGTLQECLSGLDRLIGHNIIRFDLRILNRLCGISVDRTVVVDTLVLSQLFWFSLDGGHSLEAWGKRLNFLKLPYKEFEKYTPEMLEYCINDVHLTHKVYDYLRNKLKPEYFERAIKVEHEVAWICLDMEENGFKWDVETATKLHSELRERVEELDAQMRSDFDDPDFNPGSPKQVVSKLNEAGWKPTDKTKGHLECKDKEKLKKFKEYGWKVNETNLATLPSDAPTSARSLVERLLLNSRRSTLDEWFKAYNTSTGRIHGSFAGIGTWTHRMAHRQPNMGNVAAEKSIKYQGEHLSGLALKYGRALRSLWICDEDEWLVGTDAEGIQLRIFAHLIDDPQFTYAVTHGKKEDETDPHSLNRKALGPVCKSRDNAKTFIYAFLLGAGVGKIAEILGCDKKLASGARDNFIEAYPGLKRLRETVIPRDAKRGYFQGFDGRLVIQDSEHLMLAGYLQNGEACIMKHANVLWRKELEDHGIEYRQVNFVHDEWQTAVKGGREVAELVGRVQADAIRRTGELFNLRCPMAGSFSIGKSWYETH